MGGRTNISNEEQSDQPSVVSDDLVQIIDQKICERRRVTILDLSCEFPQILHIIMYENISVRLVYHKFCSKWVMKVLTDAHKMQRMASVLTLLEQYHKDDDEYLNHII
jgi:hypothetical protein